MKIATQLTLAALIAGVAPLCSQAAPIPANKVVTQADCTAEKLGATIPVKSIGLPVSAVTLSAPQWHEAAREPEGGASNGALTIAIPPAAGGRPAYCSVEGSMAPVDSSPDARPIHFAVALPASWSYRSAQLGGGGMDGSIPNLTGGVSMGDESLIARGFATYGSDSGHTGGGFGPPGGARGGRGGRGGSGRGRAGGAPSFGPPSFGPPDPNADNWTLNNEAIANIGYMQLKKTHDAAMVLMQRIYGDHPRLSYFFGTSQGGREALTVAQRFPADYDGIAAEVPIVSFSSLMLAPELIRIHEKPIANWVTPAKVSAIQAEFVRQCDKLDGLTDGVIDNYPACRAIFDVKQGAPNRHPWAAKRCPNNVDPNPADTTAAACLTDGQISTLEMVYSRYVFATPLANNVKTFGMWVPTTDPSGSGLILPVRYRGQEGAAPDAPMHSHLGILGVTGFLMQNLKANPLDYVEGGPLNKRREELSAILDSTNPDLSAFYKRGGKLIVVSGTNDTLASPGAQMDYYQSVIDRMGRAKVDSFARFYIIPQANHGLAATTAPVDGDGKTIAVQPLPTAYDRFGMLTGWVENNKAPAKRGLLTMRGGRGDRTMPLCSYPEFPRYTGGPADSASSYVCSAK